MEGKKEGQVHFSSCRPLSTGGRCSSHSRQSQSPIFCPVVGLLLDFPLVVSVRLLSRSMLCFRLRLASIRGTWLFFDSWESVACSDPFVVIAPTVFQKGAVSLFLLEETSKRQLVSKKKKPYPSLRFATPEGPASLLSLCSSSVSVCLGLFPRGLLTS